MSQTQHNSETVNFKIVLRGTFWEKSPAFSIWINEDNMALGTLDTQDPVTVSFSADLIEDKTHILRIRLENKAESDTLQDADEATILKDMLLHIESITLDDIELGILKWNDSIVIPDDARRPVLKGCVDLGWNSSYTIKFTSPFYLWLLEKL
jgi:hypothetical protein